MRDDPTTFRQSRYGLANPAGVVEPLAITVVGDLQDVPIPERRWIVPDWIPNGQVTMLAGDGGTGKSLLAQQLATACALGRDWLGLPVQPVKSFILACEDEDDELHRRQMSILRHYDAQLGDLENRMAWVSYIGGDASLAHFHREDGQLPTPFWHRLVQTTQELGAQLVVLDSLHDIFGGSEIDRVQARGFIRQLQDLAQGIDGAVILNSHPSLSGRNSGTGESGSTAWGNAVRSRLYFCRPGDDEDEDARVLRRMKSNYARAGAELKLTWHEGMFVPAHTATGALAVMERRACAQVFLEFLDRTNREGRAVSGSKNAGNYAPKVFATRPGRQGYSRRDFEIAMENLFTDEIITMGVPFRKANRHPAHGLVRTAQEDPNDA